jgi:hypothetical protein
MLVSFQNGNRKFEIYNLALDRVLFFGENPSLKKAAGITHPAVAVRKTSKAERSCSNRVRGLILLP